MDGLIRNAKLLRKNMTKEERHLWYDFLRDYPLRFMRQRPIDRYIVDFYCAKAKLAVELDGEQHYEEEAMKKDAERDHVLAEYGIHVLRISNAEIQRNFTGVCEQINEEVRRRYNTVSPKDRTRCAGLRS